mmetsp:Transcript_36573/g.57127  ORF Transcript_36573/g.57127 Transcript_36573/m.57127 type:complete len:146 (-) Transcript_36573:1286-1723(-)
MLADGAAAVRPETAAEEEIKRKEKLVRERMQAEYAKMQKEQQRLQEVQRELEKMGEPGRKDVEIIRDKLETVDRELAFAIKDHERKKKAYESAADFMEKKRQEKTMLCDHLRMIIHENEQRKTKKLEDLMARLGVDSPAEVFQGF